MKTIYAFINSGHGTDWITVTALSEDGDFLASHISSHETWARHDIGFTSDWKHDLYRAAYPDGFEVVWVDNPKADARVMAAYQRHLNKAEAEKQKGAA